MDHHGLRLVGVTVHKTVSLAHAPPDLLIKKLLGDDRRILLFGQPGVGKSTLVVQLARALENAGRPCACIGADPGFPAFGVPGAHSVLDSGKAPVGTR